MIYSTVCATGRLLAQARNGNPEAEDKAASIGQLLCYLHRDLIILSPTICFLFGFLVSFLKDIEPLKFKTHFIKYVLSNNP